MRPPEVLEADSEHLARPNRGVANGLPSTGDTARGSPTTRRLTRDLKSQCLKRSSASSTPHKLPPAPGRVASANARQPQHPAVTPASSQADLKSAAICGSCATS